MAKRAKVKIFSDLRQALAEALAYERGQAVELRITELPPPPRFSPRKIRRIRLSLKVSQARFARLLNASQNAVESWEQGARRPAGPTLKLLEIVARDPQVLIGKGR